MSQMRPDHQHIVGTDGCRAPGLCTTMNGTMFTNHIAVSDFDPGRRVTIKSEVLRQSSDDSAIANQVSSSDPNLSSQNAMRLDFVIRPYDYRPFNYHIGANLRPWPKFGT